jgi:hypothetical protein
VRFELTDPFEPPALKAGAIDHSAKLPCIWWMWQVLTLLPTPYEGAALPVSYTSPFRLYSQCMNTAASPEGADAGNPPEHCSDERLSTNITTPRPAHGDPWPTYPANTDEMERMTSLELVASTLARSRSTN